MLVFIVFQIHFRIFRMNASEGGIMAESKQDFLKKMAETIKASDAIDSSNYEKYNVKRGLRNPDGSGVLVGLTNIGQVHGYIIDEGEKKPVEGRLIYRGIDIVDLVTGYQADKRSGFEETCFLLLFGHLPSLGELESFNNLMKEARALPANFVEDMILKAPSPDIMNKLARNILSLYSYDKNPEDRSLDNIIRQCIEVISRSPMICAYGYQARRHFYENRSLYIHQSRPECSTAENFLQLIRGNREYSALEAEILDLCLVLHAEHGGGNNSTFAVHLVTSADTDTYSALAAGVTSLKGNKHGGANNQVMGMIDDIKANCDWKNEKALENYLVKILNKEVYDKSGLIYGMGHAVYTLSDPRAIILKKKAFELAQAKGLTEEYNLYLNIEKMAPRLFAEVKKNTKEISANVDFFSGFVYEMLSIPRELYTPIFAIARMPGWCAHRLEEIIAGGRIIRPAFKCIREPGKYRPLAERT
jgi:citrate synthase